MSMDVHILAKLIRESLPGYIELQTRDGDEDNKKLSK